MSTVSIVIPCYNGRTFLPAALASALHQTHPPLEVIVVDDGSTDGSAEVASEFGEKVRVLRQPTLGESSARNAGVAEARGDYLLFLDADDLLDPAAIETQLANIRGLPDAVALMGHARFDEDPTRPYDERPPQMKTFLPDVIHGLVGPPHGWLVPRSLVLRVGGFAPQLKYSEDWDLWCRVALTGATLVPVRFVGALYRRHAESQTATALDADRARAQVVILERLCTEFLHRSDLLAEHGRELFWFSWGVILRSRSVGVGWEEVRLLARRLEEMCQTGPPVVRSSQSALLVRWFGMRAVSWMRTVLER